MADFLQALAQGASMQQAAGQKQQNLMRIRQEVAESQQLMEQRQALFPLQAEQAQLQVNQLRGSIAKQSTETALQNIKIEREIAGTPLLAQYRRRLMMLEPTDNPPMPPAGLTHEQHAMALQDRASFMGTAAYVLAQNAQTEARSIKAKQQIAMLNAALELMRRGGRDVITVGPDGLMEVNPDDLERASEELRRNQAVMMGVEGGAGFEPSLIRRDQYGNIVSTSYRPLKEDDQALDYFLRGILGAQQTFKLESNTVDILLEKYKEAQKAAQGLKDQGALKESKVPSLLSTQQTIAAPPLPTPTTNAAPLEKYVWDSQSGQLIPVK